MDNEEHYARIYALVERAILTQVDLEDLGIERIDPTLSITEDLGVDSVDFLSIVFEIEQELKLELPTSEWAAQAGGGRRVYTVEAFVGKIVELIERTRHVTA